MKNPCNLTFIVFKFNSSALNFLISLKIPKNQGFLGAYKIVNFVAEKTLFSPVRKCCQIFDLPQQKTSFFACFHFLKFHEFWCLKIFDFQSGKFSIFPHQNMECLRVSFNFNTWRRLKICLFSFLLVLQYCYFLSTMTYNLYGKYLDKIL